MLLVAADASYVGCFQDTQNGGWIRLSSNAGSTTSALCKQLALQRGFMYAGLQYGSDTYYCSGANDTNNYNAPGKCQLGSLSIAIYATGEDVFLV